jgi:hypothetical protein
VVRPASNHSGAGLRDRAAANRPVAVGVFNFREPSVNR